jgi:flagellar assembly factor FliW
MNTIVTRFGEIEYDPDNLLHFPAGLIGLPNLQRFVVMPNKKEGPLFWIQSIDDPDMAFVLTDPSNFYPTYRVQPEPSEKQRLQIENGDDCYVLVVVTVPRDQKITLNLAAPILFAPKTNRALQIILEDSDFSSRTPLPQA